MDCEYCLNKDIDYFETETISNKNEILIEEINRYECDKCGEITEERISS